jgi:hypothetical protein
VVESFWFTGAPKCACKKMTNCCGIMQRRPPPPPPVPASCAALDPPSPSCQHAPPPAAASTLLIVAFCVVQCFYAPLEPLDSGANAFVEKATLAFTVAFTLEILLKCTAWAFVLDDGESLGGMWRGLRKGGAAGLKTVVLGAPTEQDKLAQGLAAAAVQFKAAGKWRKAGTALKMVNQHKAAALDSLPAPGRSKGLGSLAAPFHLASSHPLPGAQQPRAQPQQQDEQQQAQQQQQQAPPSRHNIRGDSAHSTQLALEALHELAEQGQLDGEVSPAGAAAAQAPASPQMDRAANLPMGHQQQQPQLQQSQPQLAGAAQGRPRKDSAEWDMEAGGDCRYACLPPGPGAGEGSPLKAVQVVPAVAPATLAAPAMEAAVAGKGQAPPAVVASQPAQRRRKRQERRGPFLRNAWGQLDMFVVTASWIT